VYDNAEMKAGYDKFAADAAEYKAGFDKAVYDNAEQKAQVGPGRGVACLGSFGALLPTSHCRGCCLASHEAGLHHSQSCPTPLPAGSSTRPRRMPRR
jgi:hypothetical protein